MKAAGCDVLVTIAIPKFGAQAIRKAAEIGWKPLHILNGIASFGRRDVEAGRPRKRQGHHQRQFSSRTRPIPQWKNDAGL